MLLYMKFQLLRNINYLINRASKNEDVVLRILGLCKPIESLTMVQEND